MEFSKFSNNCIIFKIFLIKIQLRRPLKLNVAQLGIKSKLGVKIGSHLLCFSGQNNAENAQLTGF